MQDGAGVGQAKPVRPSCAGAEGARWGGCWLGEAVQAIMCMSWGGGGGQVAGQVRPVRPSCAGSARRSTSQARPVRPSCA